MSAPLPVLHLTDNLALGGCTRVMENLASLANRAVFLPVVAGIRGDGPFVSYLQDRGIRAGVVGEDLSGLAGLLHGEGRFVAVIHRSGEGTPLWNRVLPALRASGPYVVMMEVNIFGYPDRGPASGEVDLTFCNSLHTLWRYWRMSGRPEPNQYLKRHRVLYNAVTLNPSTHELADARGRARDRLGIPPEAFVIGDVCRPTPGKLDYMTAAVLPRLIRELRDICFVARTFPQAAARRMEAKAGGRFHNLPPTHERSDLLETYAALDALVHMSTMGESFGMAVAEAMRCGLPVVANETPGRKQNNAQIELVIHGETGFLASDPVSVVRRLVELARLPELRRRMGEAARARFRRPPLAPESVIGQLESEIVRIARRKGRDIPGAPEPAERLPSDEEMKEYLLSYRARYTVRPVARGLGERAWNAWTNARRFLWRVRRKLVS